MLDMHITRSDRSKRRGISTFITSLITIIIVVIGDETFLLIFVWTFMACSRVNFTFHSYT